MNHNILSKNEGKVKKSVLTPKKVLGLIAASALANGMYGATGFSTQKSAILRVRDNLKFTTNIDNTSYKKIRHLGIVSKGEASSIIRPNPRLYQTNNSEEFQKNITEPQFLNNKDIRFELSKNDAKELFGDWLIDEEKVEKYRQKMNNAITEYRNKNKDSLTVEDRILAGQKIKQLDTILDIQDDIMKLLGERLTKEVTELAKINRQIIDRELKDDPYIGKLTDKELYQREVDLVHKFLYAHRESMTWTKNDIEKKLFLDNPIYLSGSNTQKSAYLDKYYKLSRNAAKIRFETRTGIFSFFCKFCDKKN